MYCKNCGKVLSTEDKFCSNCGEKVKVDRPAPTESEPMFFVQKREEKEIAKEKERRPKRVIHLDEFNWNLDGYPTTPKKTDDIDFDWDSVVEEHMRKASPKLPEEEEPEVTPEAELPLTVESLLTDLPQVEEEAPAEEPAVEPAEAVREEPEPSEAPAKEPLFDWTEEPEAAPAPVLKKKTQAEPVEEVHSLEQIFQNMDTTPIEEPTKLIDKSQMKAESVDRFYIFSKKQAEFQALLDQEYEKIQNSLVEKQAAVPVETPAPAPAEVPTPATPAEKPAEAVREEPAPAPVEESKAEEPTVEEIPAEAELQMVAVIWAKPPAGIVVEASAAISAPAEELPAEPTEEPADVPVEEPAKETLTDKAPTDETPAEQPAETDDEESGDEPEEEPKEETNITFADIFDDDDEDEDQGKGGKFLKVLAIILCILVALELAVLGIQHFAPDSKAAGFINDAYNSVIELVTGRESVPDPEEMEGPTEIEQIITQQMDKNVNLIAVEENTRLLFEEDKDYGYADFKDSFTFQNSAWYDEEDGGSVTFADEIVGTIIQYYSALVDKKNAVNKDILDYVDKNSDYFEKADAIEGTDDNGYSIKLLEIGEMRTGEKGFYVIVSISSVDKENPNGVTEKNIVYLEPNTSKKEMKIKDIKTI